MVKLGIKLRTLSGVGSSILASKPSFHSKASVHWYAAATSSSGPQKGPKYVVALVNMHLDCPVSDRINHSGRE